MGGGGASIKGLGRHGAQERQPKRAPRSRLKHAFSPLRKHGSSACWSTGWPQREIINAIFYVLRAGCAWRMLPQNFPPWRTVNRWFARLRDGGVFASLNHHQVMHDRERAGREASPSAAVIDSQSVRPRRAAAHAAMVPGRRSRVASAMRWRICVSPILRQARH